MRRSNSGWPISSTRKSWRSGRLERRIRFALAREFAGGRSGYHAQYDDLTGLANRPLFRDRLERGLAAARRHHTFAAIMMMDLNSFKPINDRFGHAAGDHVLRAISDRLSSRLRETDTVARFGGDEFAVVLENIQSPEDAEVVARNIADGVAEPIWLDGRELVVTAAIGVAVYPQDGELGETLIRHADAAMYRAKKENGSCCRFHDSKLDRKFAHGSLLERDLRDALSRGDLRLHFQPQVTLRSPLIGLSGTMRWQHGEHGLLSTERFRRLAEDSGLVERMTHWMVDTAIARLRAWHDEGMPKLHIALPIFSRSQIDWTNLVHYTAAGLDEAEMDRDSIELEMDEQLLLEELQTGGTAFDCMRENGIRVAVTGFGVSVGSLSLLRDVPLHTLKLSRHLLRGTPKDKRRTLFADAVIQLGRHLGYRLVAEGIDDPAQLSMLRRAGADAVQSVLSCPPLSAERLSKMAGDRCPLEPFPFRRFGLNDQKVRRNKEKELETDRT